MVALHRIHRPTSEDYFRPKLCLRRPVSSAKERERMWRWWILLVLLLDPRIVIRSTADCSYDLTFFPSSECLDEPRRSSSRVSVLVELGNEQQEFVMWGQSDLQLPGDKCGETSLRLRSSGNCLPGICQMRLIRFYSSSSSSSSSSDDDWLLRSVTVQSSSEKNLVRFNITAPIPVDGQVSVGSCLDSSDEIEDYNDEVGDIDWS